MAEFRINIQVCIHLVITIWLMTCQVLPRTKVYWYINQFAFVYWSLSWPANLGTYTCCWVKEIFWTWFIISTCHKNAVRWIYKAHLPARWKEPVKCCKMAVIQGCPLNMSLTYEYSVKYIYLWKIWRYWWKIYMFWIQSHFWAPLNISCTFWKINKYD